MTVALDNMKGIGWQRVPDFMSGTALSKSKQEKKRSMWGDSAPQWATEQQNHKPLSEMGPGFFQRVFTSKQRFDLSKKAVGAVLVGQQPHDFALRTEGEDDHAHVVAANRSHRASHDEAVWPPKQSRWDFLQTETGKCDGIRRINGEALHAPAPADLRGGGQIDPKNAPKDSAQAKLSAKDQGPYEQVDPIDAAIAITSGSGLKAWRQECPDPSGAPRRPGSPQKLPLAERKVVEDRYNKDKNLTQLGPEAQRAVLEVVRYPDGMISALVQESPNEARER